MERIVVGGARGAVLLLLATYGPAGCFDVHALDLLVIDTFNAGTLQPTDPGFGAWTCYGINPQTTPVTCALDGDTQDRSPGGGSLLLDVMVSDVMNGFQEHGGGALVTNAIAGPVDLSRFTQMGFDIKLTSGLFPLPAEALVYAELGCSTVSTEAEDMRHDLYVSQGVSYGSSWQTDSLTIVNFGPPQWLTEPIKGGTPACLRNVDSIRFSIDSQLPDGGMGDGLLRIDNLVLK